MKIDGDSIDIENLRRMLDSAAYRMVKDRLQATAEATIRDLRVAPTWEAALRAQAKLDALELAAQMPKQLIQEIKRANQQ